MRFETTLFRHPGQGGWTFARIPDAHAPPVSHGWGRTPVTATVDGLTWDTSVWRDTRHGTLLAVPKHVRRGKGDGDTVEVELALREVDVTGAARIDRPSRAAPARRREPR